MFPFTIYYADCLGQASNCRYPHRLEVRDPASLARAVGRDYVCAEYRDAYRKNGNFLSSDCLPVDCDNDHSENPDDWVYPADVQAAFPDVAFYVHFSRNHMREKGGKAARPKFHVLFPIDRVTDPKAYGDLKRRVCALFPYFDRNALDAARFFFGTSNPQVAVIDGGKNLTAFLKKEEEFDRKLSGGSWENLVIPQGRRNATLSRYAGRILKRYGDGSEARRVFDELSSKCSPPLEQKELDTIWKSALRFYRERIASNPDYVPPDRYSPAQTPTKSLKPPDYSDVGQAVILQQEYFDKLRYSPSTDYIVYNGKYWEESKPRAQALAQELTDRQLAEADEEIRKSREEMVSCGAWQIFSTMGPKRAAAAFSAEQAQSYRLYEEANAYHRYAVRRRDSRLIAAALQEGRPKLEIDQKELDKDEFLLNTPSGTYDLRRGLSGRHEHRASDFITKMTAVAPSDEGAELWEDALRTFFLGDRELIAYVQEIVGLAAIGKVYIEALIIAYGEGRNGKSTFWNTVARVLGSYSGNLSADTLTVNCKRNVKPELAEAKGKRLIIAAELQEGVRLNNANVKQLCSTDEIYAEKKYKDPFSYVPSHTLVLYTNHLPKVGAIDAGTWRRLIVIPFGAKIEGDSDIKNYSDDLFAKAGGAILSWIMEGAARVIAKNYRIVPPRVVREAIERYREDNDWLAHFLDECCEVGIEYSAKSGAVYNAYRNFCLQSGEYVRSTTDFYSALESAGSFARRRTNVGRMICGLRLKSEFLE